MPASDDASVIVTIQFTDRNWQCTTFDLTAAQANHLAPVFTYLGEFIENSIRALRGKGRAEKRIGIRLYLPSQAGDKAVDSSAQDYLAFDDTGSGMTLETLQAWAKLANAPQEFLNTSDCAANVEYFADGNYSCFGVGSKYAGFLLGASMLIMTRPNDPASQILQMRVTKKDLNNQEQTAEGSFRYSASTRDPGIHSSLTPEELSNQDLMRLINKFDKQEHGTLIVITDLNHSRTEELKAKSFQTLHTYLTGTYFYLCAPGGEPARANFMHGSGYKYGPINFTVSAVGFSVDGPNEPYEEQVHRLGNKPWASWPAPAPSVAEQQHEDVMHKLARTMNSSYFPARLALVPQVHGSKFVVGINIPGDGNEKDAFALLYFHYLPNLEGRYTMEDLGLPPNVRWLPFWKGRLMQYPDLTAILPIMKQRWSDRTYRDLVQKHVVVQMFLPGVVGVNSFKTQFLRPLNHQLENLPDNCYYNVDEQTLYSSTAYGTELFLDGQPGPGITSERKTVLEKNFCKWVEKAAETFDDKWVLEDQFSQAGLQAGCTAYKTLKAKHQDDTYCQGDHMVVTHAGLSWYKQADGKAESQQKFVGSVAYFKQAADGGMADAKVMLYREPIQIYGNELFELSIFRLERADEKTRKKEAKRAQDSAPDKIKVTFDPKRVHRLHDGAEDRPIECLARFQLPAATVNIFSKQKSSASPGIKITHWTCARNQPKHRSDLERLVVKQTVCFADGPNQGKEVFCSEAQLTEQNEDSTPTWCFVFDAPNLQLPRPGRYVAKFTATALNRGGPQYYLKKEKAVHYKAVSGPVHSCSMGGMPETQQLGTPLNSLYVEFEDAHGNSCRLREVSAIKLSSQEVVLGLEGHQWDESEPGKHRLLLPSVSIAAGSSLTQDWFPAANQSASIGCSVEVVGTIGRQAVSVQQDFILQVLPGIPAEIVLQPQPEWFNPSAAVRLPNHSTVPEFTLQLRDAAGLKTTPFAQGDRAEVRLLGDPAGDQQPSLTGNQVFFDSRSGAAVFTALQGSLPAVSTAKPVTFVAFYQGQPDVSGLSMPAEVLPCMDPFALRFFLDAQMSKPIPCDETDPAQFVLQHTAGDTVHQLYMTINTEGGERLEVCDLSTVKCGKKVMTCQRHADSIFLVEWGQLLKLPDSVRDPKDVEVQVRGKEAWRVAATITLQPISGPGVAWALRCDTGFTTAKNGESLSSKVFACVEDKHHNVASLPSTFPKVLPKLTVTYQSQEQRPGLEFLNSQHGNVYNGGWQLLQSTGLSSSNLAAIGPSDKVLVLRDLVLVGPPGKVQLGISANGGRGQQLAQGTLPFELKAGPLVCWRLNNQPSGIVPSHMVLESMTITAHDVGGNQVDLPTGELFVELSATSTSGPLFDSAQKLVSSKQGKTLAVNPVALVCGSSGALALELFLKRKQQRNVRTLDTMTVDLSVILSNQIVTSLDILHPSPSTAAFTAGEVPPLFRFGVQVENGSSPQSMQPFIPNLSARLRHPDATSIALSVESNSSSPQQVVCSSTQALTQAGTYQVSLEYHDPHADAHGLNPTEAHLQLVRTFEVTAGAVHKLSLGMSLAPRKCLNAGQVVDRTVLPQTTLFILDRCGNVVKEERSAESVAVTVAVLDADSQSAVDSSMVNISINSIQIPLAVGQVSLDSISVKTARAGTPVRTAHAGNYILDFSVSDTMMPPVEPVRVAFEVIEASDANTARERAKIAVHDAQQKLKSLEQKATASHHAVIRIGAPMREQLAQVQEILGIAVDQTNWQAVQREYQHRQQQDASSQTRPAKHRHQLPQQAEQQLRAILGVIGYVYEFVFVEDERYAALLSWHKSDWLNRLVVEDAAARSRIDTANIRGVGRSPSVLLLSKINALRDNTSLPHTGTNCILPGMDCVVRMAPDVTVHIPPERMPNSSQQARSDAMAKLKQAVVGSMLCMPTELGPQGASAYSEAVFVQLKQACFPILCKDTGALVTSSGLEGGGASSCAPASLDLLPGYFGQMPRQQTDTWQTNARGLAALQRFADCQHDVAQAQARRNEADAAVQVARADLQRCQHELRKADKQAQDLQQLLSPVNVPNLAISNRNVANGAHAGKRSHTAAAATDQTSHSPAMTSPTLRDKAARTR